jgi:hypothetical protein
VPAATSDVDADLAADAVAGAVALVASWAHLISEVHARLIAPDSRGAATSAVEATPGSRTPPVVNGRLTRTPPLLCAGRLREQSEQPTTQQGGAGELERLTPGDGAGGKPLGHLVKAIASPLL